MDISFNLCDRQLEDECRLLCFLVVNDGEDRQNEFNETQITKLLRRLEFAVEGLALISGYGKTKARASGGSFCSWHGNYKTERAFPDAGCSSSAAAAFFRFSKILFLEVYSITARGNLDILKQSDMLALFCSRRCPGDLILKLYDYARELRQQNATVIGGFHTPMEQECLTILLRGAGSLVICPARSLENMRLPASWKKLLDAGRLLLLSPFTEKQHRVTANQANLRNEFVAALATQITIVYADTGGKTEQLAARITDWHKSLFTFDSAANSNLINLGARGLTVASGDGRFC